MYIKSKSFLKKQNLIQDIIKFDFLILEQKLNLIKKSKHIHFYSKINNKKFVFSLNPQSTIHELKQLNRNIRFLNYHPKKNLNILLNNKNLNFFFKNLLKIKKRISLTSVEDFKLKKDSAKIQSLLYINEESFFTQKFYQQLILNQIILTTKMNLSISKNFFGFYHIFNDLSNYKKIIFMIAFLNISFEQFKETKKN